MDFGCMLGWFLGGFLMVLEGFWMNVGWICDGRCMEFCFFLCFLDCLNFMIFLKWMAHSWRTLWQSSGKVWHGYGKTVARLWPGYSKVLEKNHGRVHGKGMAKRWQSDGDVCSHVDQSFDHVMSRIWQSYGRALAKFGNYGEVKAKPGCCPCAWVCL